MIQQEKQNGEVDQQHHKITSLLKISGSTSHWPLSTELASAQANLTEYATKTSLFIHSFPVCLHCWGRTNWELAEAWFFFPHTQPKRKQRIHKKRMKKKKPIGNTRHFNNPLGPVRLCGWGHAGLFMARSVDSGQLALTFDPCLACDLMTPSHPHLRQVAQSFAPLQRWGLLKEHRAWHHYL